MEPRLRENIEEWAVATQKRRDTERSLWYWNASMAALHGAQAIAVLVASQTVPAIKKYTVSLTTNMPSWALGYPVSAVQQRGSLPFAATASGFAFMSAAAHLIVLANFSNYIENLRKGINPYRWWEYAASSSLMIILIAMLFGIYDIVSLMLIVCLNASMNFFGLLHERFNHGKLPDEVNWEPFAFGCFVGAAPWAAIFTYIAALPDLGKVPGFVWGILFAYAIFFNCFAVNMYLQYKRIGWWSDEYGGYAGSGYLMGEKMYQILSLVAKSFLLWLVLGGCVTTPRCRLERARNHVPDHFPAPQDEPALLVVSLNKNV